MHVVSGYYSHLPPRQPLCDRFAFLAHNLNRIFFAFYNCNTLVCDRSHLQLFRNPTQLVNATAATTGSVASSAGGTTRSSCPCVRSKSMEDVRSDVVVDWPTYIKDNFKNLNNGRELPPTSPSSNGGGGASTAVPTMLTTATKHTNTRRSMDNLLKVDTNFGRPFQVRYVVLCCERRSASKYYDHKCTLE